MVLNNKDIKWVDFYTEFATKLMLYKNNRKKLIEIILNVYDDLRLKFPKMEGENMIEDIDPFTIFGLFNKGITIQNRIKIITGFSEKFNIESAIPEKFEGIPVVNNQNATFFYGYDARIAGDIDRLWDVFEIAIEYDKNSVDENKEKFIEQFDKVIRQKGLKWKITMGLYWIRPNTFINLDEKNRNFLVQEKLLDEDFYNKLGGLKDIINGKQYLELCEKAKKSINSGDREYSSFPEFSAAAFENNSNKPKKESNVVTGTKDKIKNMNTDVINVIDNVCDVNKNTILYGPPGTGKTYNTVIYAVAIIEKKKLQNIKNEDYEMVLERYNQYKSKGLIEFTTFHQSYGYEDFIEGIKPVMRADNDEISDIQYEVVPGLFKKFCENATVPVMKKQTLNSQINNSPSIWKVSLEGTGDNPTREECLKNGHIRIGYDRYGKDIKEDTNFTEGGQKVLNTFIYKMKIGDIVLSCYSATTIDAIGVIVDDYEWHDEYDKFKRLRKVEWLVKNIKEDILAINNGFTLTLASVYQLKNMSLVDVMNIVHKYSAKNQGQEEKKNRVFVIDEINRGNISKIFGELITLIENTKRIGQLEEMTVKLPYSQKKFGVPDNVYIIGTMNTADRSIATIDTALRRRFRFKEMMPDSNVLEGIYVGDISIKNMLDKINQRITVLYDREHMLGHAYFIPLKEDPTIETLAEIFSNSIIPLLQEYFYEDYEKIRMVLGDNNKANVEEQFIRAIVNVNKNLFGATEYNFDETYIYEVNHEAFGNLEAYKLI